jgi:hypothetical protein
VYLKWGYGAYRASLSLIAAAISIAVNKRTKLACILLGIMIFFFRNFNRNSTNYKQGRVSAYITDTFKEASLDGCAFILAGAKPGSV